MAMRIFVSSIYILTLLEVIHQVWGLFAKFALPTFGIRPKKAKFCPHSSLANHGRVRYIELESVFRLVFVGVLRTKSMVR